MIAARRWIRYLLLVPTLLLPACDDMILEDQTFTLDARGTVLGSVFVDLDGNGSMSEADVPMVGLGVEVVAAQGGGRFALATTDVEGAFVATGVPVGTFRIGVDSTTLPDSLDVFGLDPDPFVLGAGDTLRAGFRTSFPVFTLAEVQGLEPGRRVFTHGIALNSRDPVGDGAVHLQAGDSYLRATAVDRVSLLAGDSVRLQGRTAREAGLPVLTDVRAFVLRERAVIPRPVDLSTAEAASARGEELNAALVRIAGAQVTDTATVDADLVATVDDGSGPVEVAFRNFIEFDTSLLEPGVAVLDPAVGLLVAHRLLDGTVEWRLVPRVPTDVTVQ